MCSPAWTAQTPCHQPPMPFTAQTGFCLNVTSLESHYLCFSSFLSFLRCLCFGLLYSFLSLFLSSSSLPPFFPPCFFSSASLSEALKVYFSIHVSTLMKDSNIPAPHPHSSFLTNKTSKILFYKGKFPLQKNHQLLSEPLPTSTGAQSSTLSRSWGQHPRAGEASWRHPMPAVS